MTPSRSLRSRASGLSEGQICAFIEEGYLKLEDAVDPALVAKVRASLWNATGLSPDQPDRWTRPVIRLGFMTAPEFVAAANTNSLHLAYDALAGQGRWSRPTGLGTFPIRFPSSYDPGDAGWHVDMSYGTENPDFMQWRVNVLSRGRLLLMLFLFSDVGKDDAPTRLRKGSHLETARQLMPYGEKGLTLQELAADGFASTSHCEEALATGAAGTVYLCHPFIVHSAQPHRGTEPRLMAQPALLPCKRFGPTHPPTPVQLAIRRACGLSNEAGHG